MPWGLLWFLLNTYFYFLIQLFLKGREWGNEMNHFCFLLTCALTPSPVIIWFSFDFIFISYLPFCKANRHWIRYGKHTPLYGRYHFYCHFLVFCALLLFFFFDFLIMTPFPKTKKKTKKIQGNAFVFPRLSCPSNIHLVHPLMLFFWLILFSVFLSHPSLFLLWGLVNPLNFR